MKEALPPLIGSRVFPHHLLGVPHGQAASLLDGDSDPFSSSDKQQADLPLVPLCFSHSFTLILSEMASSHFSPATSSPQKDFPWPFCTVSLLLQALSNV